MAQVELSMGGGILVGEAVEALRCARTVGFCRLKWKIAVTKRAYRRARRKRLQTEIRLQLLRRWHVDVGDPDRSWGVYSKRCEAELKAYRDYLAVVLRAV
jgi:hypothetical protein